jgi:hypothetical protein
VPVYENGLRLSTLNPGNPFELYERSLLCGFIYVFRLVGRISRQPGIFGFQRNLLLTAEEMVLCRPVSCRLGDTSYYVDIIDVTSSAVTLGLVHDPNSTGGDVNGPFHFIAIGPR